MNTKQKVSVELLPPMQTAPGNLAQPVAEYSSQPSQERLLLRTLIDSLPDYIYIKDRESRFLINNLAHTHALGATRPDEVVGKTDQEIFPAPLANQYYADEQMVMKSGQPLNREETTVDPRTQKTKWLQTTKVPLRDKDGEIVGLVGISRDITPIKEAEAKLDQTHKQLLDASRQAGMAEVATSVLHNVGNVLNSVNVSSLLVADKIRHSKVANINRAVALIHEHEGDLNDFLTRDLKGKQLPAYLSSLASHLIQEQEGLLQEVGSLVDNVAHIKEIVAMQQNYAKSSGVVESIKPADLVEDAVRMNSGALDRHQVKLVRDFADLPPILTEKHKVLQILVNLIRNAKYACDDSGRDDKQIKVCIANGDGRAKISVIDNGIGILPENLTRIFSHGFTTRKEGHGFGLHSGALAAKELGGTLTALSEGIGCGATFVLELPIQQPEVNI